MLTMDGPSNWQLEHQPTCKRCQDSSRICEYGLKICWVDHQRPGRRDPARKTDSTDVVSTSPRQFDDDTHVFLNTTCRDFELCSGESNPSFEETWDSDESCRSPTPRSPELSLTTLSLSASFPDPQMPHMDMLVFDFCRFCSVLPLPNRVTYRFLDANRMCTKCTLLDGDANTCRRVIIPISFRSQLVLQSCLAAAANQMTRLQSSYSQAALRYRGSCLTSLHRHIAYLSSGQIPTMVATKTEILGAILMLCFFEYYNDSFKDSIAHRSRAGWRAHLDGARKILELNPTSDSAQCDQAVTSFLGHYLAGHSVLSYATLVEPSEGEALYKGGRYWLRRTVRPINEINPFAGCSNELLAIVLEIIARIRKASLKNSEENKYFAIEMLTCLKSLAQHSPATKEDIHQSTIVSEVLDPWDHMTASSHPTTRTSHPVQQTSLAVPNDFRHSAVILCCYLDTSIPLTSNAEVQQSVSAILSTLCDGFDAPVWAKVDQGHSIFLWPYFIAACHAFQDEDRVVLVKKFRSLAGRTGMLRRVVEPMLDIVQDVWKQHDLEGCASNGQECDNERYFTFSWERALWKRGWAFNWS